jgi:hypothetical protein
LSFETSFDSKQPKLEPKLVSALSETKRLFWLFHFVLVVSFCFGLFWLVSKQFVSFVSVLYTETKRFDVLIEPKQTEDQQFNREHILVFFGKFWVVSVCFETVLFVSVVLI